MTDVCFIFEIHQPVRIRRIAKSYNSWKFFDLHIDHELNREVMERVAKKCYLPATRILLNEINRLKKKGYEFKISYSISGIFLEQAQKIIPDFIDLLHKIIETGNVELLSQTYYHSIASLFSEKNEFIEQIKMHRETINEVFGVKTQVFENTELIYNDTIAHIISKLNFKAIITEGVERILQWRSPNYVYKAKGTNLKLLFRNYKLSDDIAFRFSSTWWEEYPLTADKYAYWLNCTPGQCIIIFIDYETFGEHHWPETGIHEFLKWLPREIAQQSNLTPSTPSEIIAKYPPVDEISIPEEHTISWADIERDTSAWLSNQMQILCFNKLQELEPLIKILGDKDLLKAWRILQISDHLYYMATKHGGPKLVHNYFSYYGDPLEAFTSYFSTLLDLESEVYKRLNRRKRKIRSIKAPKGKEFIFRNKYGAPIGLRASNIIEFFKAIKTLDNDSLKRHQQKGDFFRWVADALGDLRLALQIREISPNDPQLKEKLITVLEKRIKELFP